MQPSKLAPGGTVYCHTWIGRVFTCRQQIALYDHHGRHDWYLAVNPAQDASALDEVFSILAAAAAKNDAALRSGLRARAMFMIFSLFQFASAITATMSPCNTRG